jgi:hypothetical protein
MGWCQRVCTEGTTKYRFYHRERKQKAEEEKKKNIVPSEWKRCKTKLLGNTGHALIYPNGR